jgi:DNA processing protein
MATLRSNDELRALLALLRRHGNGVRTRDWLRETGSIHAALNAAPRDASDKDAPPASALNAAIEADLAWLDRPNRHLLSVLDPDFPPLLRDSPYSPAALWIEGDPVHLWAPQIAIVGARNATPIGLSLARDFAGSLARAGLAITSGLAEGIDGAAHQAALDAGMPTIAVCGTGLAQVYPKRHATLAAKIAASGALVSEFPPEVGPRSAHFPRRNRIIAGLSLATLVVEAGARSGSLVTARLATEQGREVFAIPGSIHNPLARGCHRLIREGATLVEEASEVLAAIRPLARRLGHTIALRLAEVDMDHAPDAVPAGGRDGELVERVLAGGPADVDALVAATGLDAARVAAALVLLEVDGRVAQASGSCWMQAAIGRR